MQRILETARKMGLPVIVTDIAGREPMVVMPLEQFEAMAGTGAGEIVSEPIKTTPPRYEEPIVDDFSPKQGKKEDVTRPITSTPEPDDLSLEERFYIEPLADEEGGV